MHALNNLILIFSQIKNFKNYIGKILKIQKSALTTGGKGTRPVTPGNQ